MNEKSGNQDGLAVFYRKFKVDVDILKAGEDAGAITRLVEMAEQTLNGESLGDKRILAMQLLTSIPDKTIIHVLPALSGGSLTQFLLVLDVPGAKSLIRKLSGRALTRALNETEGNFIVQFLCKLFGEDLMLILANLPDSALSGIRKAIAGNETGVCAEESQPLSS